MSIVSGSFIGGSGYGIAPGEAPATLSPAPDVPNRESMPLGELRVSGPGSAAPALAEANIAAAGITFDLGNGACGVWNGTGFSLVNPLFGDDATYRMMDDQPTLKLARRLVTVPIEASSPTVQPAPGREPKDAWVKFIRDAFALQMGTAVHHGLRMLSRGWSAFHESWVLRDGRRWPVLTPRPVSKCQIYRYATGNGFAGVRYDGASQLWSPANCLVVSHDVEADDLYGHSEHDAAYEPYCRWLQMRMDAHLLRAKISGVIPIVFFPPGTTKINGKDVDNAEIAERMIVPQLNRQLGFTIPTSGFTTTQIFQKPELKDSSQWRIDFYDAGNLSQAQSGFIESMSYEDKLMLRAWTTPERSAIEGQFGTKADAGAHSDNATQFKQLIYNNLMAQVSHGQPAFGVWGTVDKALLFNFGPDAVGTVELRAPSIAGTDLENQADLLRSLLSSNDKDLTYEMLEMLGNDGVREAFTNFGFNPRGEFSIDNLKRALAESKSPGVSPSPGGLHLVDAGELNADDAGAD